MADWLALTERGTAQPIVSRYVGGVTRTPLSAPFGTNLGSDDVTSCSQNNCVIQVDANRLYAVLFDGLYRSTDGGATFPAQVMAFTSPTADLTRRINHGGIHLAYDAGSQELILGGWVATSIGFTIKGWTYNLTTETPGVQVNQGTLGSGDDTAGQEILFGTAVHFTYGPPGTQNNWLSFDIVAQSWATYTSPATGGGGGACMPTCVGPDGSMYRVYAYSSGVLVLQLYKFTGSWIFQGQLYAANDNPVEGGVGAARSGLFSDGTDLHAVVTVGSTNVGWKHYRITAASGFDPTAAVDLTLLVVPVALRSNYDAGTGTASGDKRCLVIQDSETTPGTMRTFLAFSDNALPGTNYTTYEFLGNASLYGTVGIAQGQVRDALPTDSRNGGAYFFTPGQRGIRILSVTPAIGGERVDYLVSGGGTVNVQFRRSIQQQPATALCTLTGTATGGGTRVGNVVQNAVADGVTPQTVIWDFFTDGISNGQGLTVLVPETI